MGISHLLASVQNRKDQEPNIELAQSVAVSGNKQDVAELVGLLTDQKAAIRSDAMKVLYELGAIRPELISNHHKTFSDLLHHKDNRMIWGAMTAIQSYAHLIPDQLYKNLPRFIEIAENGSVITRDNMMRILVKLVSKHKKGKELMTLLFEQLIASPVNQLPMYAEWIAEITLEQKHKTQLNSILSARLNDIDQDSKRKRIQKVMKKLTT